MVTAHSSIGSYNKICALNVCVYWGHTQHLFSMPFDCHKIMLQYVKVIDTLQFRFMLQTWVEKVHRTQTGVYRVPNMHSDRNAKEPGSMAWQSEHILICSDDHIVTVLLVFNIDMCLCEVWCVGCLCVGRSGWEKHDWCMCEGCLCT